MHCSGCICDVEFYLIKHSQPYILFATNFVTMRNSSAEYLLHSDADRDSIQEPHIDKHYSKKDTISGLKDKMSGSITSSVGSILGNDTMKKNGEVKISKGEGKLKQCGMNPKLPDGNHDGCQKLGPEDDFHVYYTCSGRPNPGDMA
ncbi:hypothetical protein K493DRAFT_305288 [Basidiobolus meristosporus CBS 931.73]|uniref:Uncharacterized protein n=1 Tax=Basidiobolus meristosporus CBS 931.73 TaxID=1314790 RepID=A0A1Y1XW81_9FUNG|nr:hypothetical protein K493DRAFT_305288 [Basidiobolus meristosporus CBS 931.73]|eukprot:ORX89992.1 hypothetical protein K493DRAFT_305288 [Basidiobolus meristosporus CBS 931.73]